MVGRINLEGYPTNYKFYSISCTSMYNIYLTFGSWLGILRRKISTWNCKKRQNWNFYSRKMPLSSQAENSEWSWTRPWNIYSILLSVCVTEWISEMNMRTGTVCYTKYSTFNVYIYLRLSLPAHLSIDLPPQRYIYRIIYHWCAGIMAFDWWLVSV